MNLFGRAPRPAGWDSTAALTWVREVVAAQQHHATAWQGGGGTAHLGAADTAVATLGDAVGADDATSKEMAVAGRSGHDARTAIAGIVDDAKRGIAAIAPSTDTPAGRQQLNAHLQHQMRHAQAALESAAQRDAAIAAGIRGASGGYRRTDGQHVRYAARIGSKPTRSRSSLGFPTRCGS